MATDHCQVKPKVPWKRCSVCPPDTVPVFKSPREFCAHLRDYHCTKEGGSFVCRYGMNRVCPSLPLEGVSDRDYEDHVARDHVAREPGVRPTSGQESPRSSTPTQPNAGNEPSIVQDQLKWNIFMSKTNLPAALNDPRLTRRETDFFTKTWGESFDNFGVMPHPDIPEITKDHFRKYLKRVSKRLKDHAMSSAAVADLPVVRDQKSLRPEDHFPVLLSRKIDKLSPDYEAIPKIQHSFLGEEGSEIFMQPGFNLENPATFSSVFPWSLIEPPRPENAGKPRQSSKLLQEKLSHYLDVVEVHIARQISLRSEAFFLAVSSHDKLQENMATTCATIRQLRDRVHQLDKTMAVGPLMVMRMSQTRSNYIKLYNKLKLMSTVHQTQPMIQLLLSTNDFVGALDLIATTQEVLTQELSGIHSFRHLGSQLAEMEKAIDCMMEEDFVRYVTIDLNRSLTEGNTLLEEVEHPILTESQEKLVAIVLGMLRQKRYGFIDVYREEAYTCLKAILKQTVIEAVSKSDEVDLDQAGGSLADHMRLLSYSKWMDLLHHVFLSLLVIIRRVKNICVVIEEVLQAAAGTGGNSTDVNGSSNGPLSPTSPIRVAADVEDLLTKNEGLKVHGMLRDLLSQVCDHANDRCVKVLQARSKDGFLERLSSSEFVQLSRAVEGFVGECEKLSGKRSTSLRSCLQSQASRFVNRFHEERKTKLGLILDNERWKQADVPAEFQALVDHISTSNSLTTPSKQPGDSVKKPQEYLLVDGQRYAVVGTVLLLVKMIVDYCECVEDIPSATSDILNRLIELLKMFNSRTCQLILGAGAVQLVGLRTISTKNLALASRCLQLVIHFLPMVRQHFEERLLGKQSNMIKHFDHVLKDYNDHVTELTNKLLFIMDGMLESNLNKWEVRPPMPSASFRNISKQISKLHEGISELLPPPQIYNLFESVHRNFKLLLRSQLIKLGVTNDGGPQHGLVVQDVTFYMGNLQALAGLENLDCNMEAIWDKT